MAVNSIDNMAWMAQHIHCFEFHTLQAMEFKAQLQHWWRSADTDSAQAAILQDQFLLLCQATPVEAASGWYWDSEMDRDEVADMHRFTDTLPPRADITAICLDSCFVPKFSSFYGLLTPAQRSSMDASLLSDHRSAMLLAMDNLKEKLRQTMQEFTAHTYKAIYSSYGNFSVLKGLLHAALFAFAVMLFPVWLECAEEIISTLSRYGMDSMPMLWRLRVRAPSRIYMSFPEIVMITILVPAVLLDLGQTFCEIWFGVYRLIARIVLRQRRRRSRKIHNTLTAAANRALSADGRWHRRKEPQCFALFFDMPRWVRVGTNPLFRKKLFPRPFLNIFRIYPQTPPAGRSWRSRPLFPLLIRAVILFFFVVITFNL